jgi:hypothetical protein
MRANLLRMTNSKLGAREANAILGLILAGVGFIATLTAYEKPLWFDEILTVILCRLPNASKLWQALNSAADTNPPCFYLVAGWTHRFVSDDHVGYRLPSILGLLLTVFCIYLILSRRVDRLSALIGAAFPLCTQLVTFADEARPYALMVGFVSVAILAWQRTDRSRIYSLILCLALAIALSLHYYAILVWPAFILAEATVWIFRHRFRASIWIALIVGATPLLFFARLLAHLRQYYGSHFWSPASFGMIFSAPGNLYNFINYWIWCLTIGAIVLLIFWAFGKTVSVHLLREREVSEPELPIEECTLNIVLLMLPVMAVLAAKIGGGGMTYRYMLPEVLGASLAVGFFASRAPNEIRVALLALVLMNYGLSSMFVLKKVLTGSLLKRRTAASLDAKAILNEYQKYSIPIVISPGNLYLPMVYYMPVDQAGNLYALADPKAAITYMKTDSVDLALLAVRQFFPLNVEDYNSFASKHREFILVSRRGRRLDWWPFRLSHDGDSLSLISADEHVEVFKVTVKP